MLDNFSIDQMSPRLRDFLHLVWENRNVPKLDLYKLYVGGRPHYPSNDYAAACDRPTVILFLEALAHSSNQANIAIKIQAWGDFANYDVISMTPRVWRAMKVLKVGKMSESLSTISLKAARRIGASI